MATTATGAASEGDVSHVEPRGRVLHVIYSYLIGGSEQLVLTLVRSMPEYVHGVVAIDLSGPLEREFAGLGATTWCLDRPEEGASRTLKGLDRIIREFRPTVVHTHHLHELIYSLPAAVLRRVGIVHTEHEYYSLQPAKRRYALRAFASFCGAVTGVNQETVDYLREWVGVSHKKLKLVRNGIDVDRFAGAAGDRSKLGLQESDLVIGSVARLEPVKGHDVLLRAFSKVLRAVPKAALVIVGEGSSKNDLRELAGELGVESRVRFLGARRDIPELLAAMDVVALCSKEEGLPMSLLEAMAAEKPVVATSVGGIPGLIADRETGFLVASEDVEATAAILAKILDDAVLRETVGKAAANAIKTTFPIERTISSYQELYDVQ